MLSFQLFVDGDHLGALNLFGSDVGVFDAESERIGALIAAHAAVALAGSPQVSRLTQALDTRDLIGQAKGILMERFKITAHLPPPCCSLGPARNSTSNSATSRNS